MANTILPQSLEIRSFASETSPTRRRLEISASVRDESGNIGQVKWFDNNGDLKFSHGDRYQQENVPAADGLSAYQSELEVEVQKNYEQLVAVDDYFSKQAPLRDYYTPGPYVCFLPDRTFHYNSYRCGRSVEKLERVFNTGAAFYDENLPWEDSDILRKTLHVDYDSGNAVVTINAYSYFMKLAKFQEYCSAMDSRYNLQFYFQIATDSPDWALIEGIDTYFHTQIEPLDPMRSDGYVLAASCD